MHCPRCETSVLSERDRDGITIDVCPGCRGLWLDRGELEKLIARATRELDELSPRHDDTPPRGMNRHPGDSAYGHDRRYPKRKKSWVESLGDIFD